MTKKELLKGTGYNGMFGNWTGEQAQEAIEQVVGLVESQDRMFVITAIQCIVNGALVTMADKLKED